jgi:putative ATP-binding cassette transporter
VLIAVVTACGCFLYLALLSPALIAVCLAIGLPVAWGCKVIHRRARRRVRAAFRSRDVIFEHFRSLTEGIKELKLNATRQRAFVDELLEQELASHRDQVAAARLWNQVSVTSSQASVLLLLLGILICANWLPTNAATLTTFAVVLLYAKTAVQGVLTWLPTYSEAETAIASLETLGFSLTAPPQTQPERAPSAPQVRPMQLDLAGVCFRYETDTVAHGDESFALGPLDLTLQSGEVVFVIGSNGSGKTTLMKLLIGLYAPSAGELRLNGKKIDDHNREWYCQHFSVVFADFYLFTRLLGLDADDLPVRVGGYLEQLQLTDLVTLTGDELSTTRLSHGQCQRLALLTAYLEDRPVYVFDEWAANQDPNFRDVFYRRILPELKARGKLVVVISHDDRYFDVADRLIRLTDGDITPQAQPTAA